MATNQHEEEYDTDREVGGIVYHISKVYDADEVGKERAQIEAYFERQTWNRFARPMRVKVGPHKGKWACFVSYVKRGD